MEEILASIRRIIADDDANKVARPADAAPKDSGEPAPRPPSLPPAPPPAALANSQDDIDAMLANVDPPAVEPAGSDVFELTEEMTTPANADPAPSFRTIDASSDIVFSERSHEAAPEPTVRIIEEARRPPPQPAPPQPVAPPTPAPDTNLMSNVTRTAVNSAFNTLASTVIGQNARTLEDLVKEMLRPLLKSWLDDNLPGLVERIVRAEIERVARGRN